MSEHHERGQLRSSWMLLGLLARLWICMQRNAMQTSSCMCNMLCAPMKAQRTLWTTMLLVTVSSIGFEIAQLLF